LRNVRILAGAVLAITFATMWGTAASAHVTVQPATVEQGARGRFVFRVPNESATASTIKLAVKMPTDAAYAATVASVRVSPKTGWDVAIEKEALNPPIKGEGGDITQKVSTITWTAQPGYKIGPDQFDEFDFTTGVLPKDKTEMAFKAVQTYDGPLADGSTEANWVEVRQAGQQDPKRPEPLVKLTPPAATAGAATGTATAAPGSDDLAAIKTSAEDAKNAANSAKTFSILALLIGIIALLVAIAAIVTKPKAPAAPAPVKDPEAVDA
jgi:uncharacterized protein YcnI